jgi:hypothetical protein
MSKLHPGANPGLTADRAKRRKGEKAKNKEHFFSRSQAPAWERQFSPKLCLGTFCSYNHFKLHEIFRQAGAWQKKESESHMPQKQRPVELLFSDNRQGVAIATGNNACWLCPCGYKDPLIGRSGNTPVECPACRRNYLIVPENNKAFGRVLSVKEIQSTKTIM